MKKTKGSITRLSGSGQRGWCSNSLQGGHRDKYVKAKNTGSPSFPSLPLTVQVVKLWPVTNPLWFSDFPTLYPKTKTMNTSCCISKCCLTDLCGPSPVLGLKKGERKGGTEGWRDRGTKRGTQKSSIMTNTAWRKLWKRRLLHTYSRTLGNPTTLK